MSSVARSAAHRWRFLRLGGFDQVLLETPEDLVNLGSLDPKLWVALAAPVKGTEFDPRTLALLDTDHDGSIRVPEIVAAAEWAGRLLRDRSPLARADGVVPLAAIDDTHDEGRHLKASARRILDAAGKTEATAIAPADVQDVAAIYAQMRCNGDGLVPAELADRPDDAAAIEAILATLGGEADRGGNAGVDAARIERFFDDAAACLAWHEKGEADSAVRALGADTSVAAEAFRAVRAKVDDHFTRSRLAAFDPKAAVALSPAEATYGGLGSALLAPSLAEIGALPLAAVDATARLPLTTGLNPAWQKAIAALAEKAIVPILGARDALTLEDWARVCRTFDAHEAWMSARPDTPVATLGVESLRTHAVTGRRERLLALVALDAAAAPEADGIAGVERLARYCRDLLPFARNFVNFSTFYTGGRAVFQAGTLYLDGRSCDLTVSVLDAAKHAALATRSGVYLAYCDCVRPGGETRSIAAAFTDGDSSELFAGRNGVFWDREGRDWNATIVRLVEHPISVRQAFWTPYRKVGRFIGDQIRNFASARSDATDAHLSAGVEANVTASMAAEPRPPGPPPPTDMGRSVGIFAAVALALGALGTAVTAIVTGFLGLSAWQMPLVLLGLMLLISGPSMLLAWLKLRRRALGPLLDSNGWAVNARARINIRFGRALTGMARLPPGAERSVADPLKEKSTVWTWVLLLVVALAVGAGLRWGHLLRL
jgi:hypothetical protein